mgnify:CR=1 FL=1
MTTSRETPKRKTVSTTKMFADAMRDLLPYTNLPYQLAVTILVFFGIGYGLDNWLNLYPTLTVSLSIVGVALGLYSFTKSAIQLSSKKSTKSQQDDTH